MSLAPSEGSRSAHLARCMCALHVLHVQGVYSGIYAPCHVYCLRLASIQCGHYIRNEFQEFQPPAAKSRGW